MRQEEMFFKLRHVFFFFILAGLLWLCHCLKGFYEPLKEEWALFGCFVSVLGLWFTIDQIIKTKRIAKQTSDTAENTLKEVKSKITQVNKAFTLSDISALAKLPSAINGSIEHEEYERAYDKMELLQEGLIELRNNPDCIQNIDDIDSFIADLTIRLRSVNKSVSSRSKPYKYDEIFALMNQIRVFLLSKSAKMKYDEFCGD